MAEGVFGGMVTSAASAIPLCSALALGVALVPALGVALAPALGVALVLALGLALSAGVALGLVLGLALLLGVALVVGPVELPVDDFVALCVGLGPPDGWLVVVGAGVGVYPVSAEQACPSPATAMAAEAWRSDSSFCASWTTFSR